MEPDIAKIRDESLKTGDAKLLLDQDADWMPIVSVIEQARDLHEDVLHEIGHVIAMCTVTAPTEWKLAYRAHLHIWLTLTKLARIYGE